MSKSGSSKNKCWCCKILRITETDWGDKLFKDDIELCLELQNQEPIHEDLSEI